MSHRPAVGEFAPDFTLLADDGAPVTLSSYRGQWVVLYFYAADDTEPCMKEAVGFRALAPRFASASATILGVSPDSVASHARFKAKYDLSFTLLADPDRHAIGLYDVWREKTVYARTLTGVERVTFLIDPEGKVARHFEVRITATHARDVVRALERLSR